ncbi:MAG: hypothetical protein ACTSUK_01965 [Promethearchaeota archaeon]
MHDSHRRRNLKERIEAIFEFIERQPSTFPKSRLKEIGLNPSTAGKWLELIEYIQNQPKIRLIRSSHNTLIEKTEGNYQALMRRMLTDNSVPFEDRLQFSTDYLRSLYIREQMEMPRNSSQRRDDKKNYSKLLRMYSIQKILDSFAVLIQVDPRFGRYFHIFEEVRSVEDENERDLEFKKILKRFMSSDKIKNDIQTFLDDSSINGKLQEIEEQDLGFTKKVKNAIKVLRTLFLN